MREELSNKIFPILKIAIVVIFALLVSIFLFLTALDHIYPGKGYRLALLIRFNIPKPAFLVKLLTPNPDKDKQFHPTTMFWFYKDQKTLDPKYGYWCAIYGEIINNDSDFWQVKADNGQTFQAEVAPSSRDGIFYRVRHEGKNLVWEKLNRENFKPGDRIKLTWDCLVLDPQKLLEDNLVKEKFLKVRATEIVKEDD